MEIALKYAKMTKSKKTSKTRQKFTSEWNQKLQHLIPHASISLLCIRFVPVAFRSEEVVS